MKDPLEASSGDEPSVRALLDRHASLHDQIAAASLAIATAKEDAPTLSAQMDRLVADQQGIVRAATRIQTRDLAEIRAKLELWSRENLGYNIVVRPSPLERLLLSAIRDLEAAAQS